MFKTNFLGDEIPKENVHYTCMACITIDSVMKMEEKELSTSLFRRMQIQNKKTKMHKFINTELKSESKSEWEPDNELLKSKSELESGTE